MLNALLYFVTWVSWGASWIAIKWQNGVVPVPQSIAYRFALAALVLFAALMLLKKLQTTYWRDHLFFLLQGACLYSLNFVAFYNATTFISSGLVPVVMSTVTIMNALHGRLIWNKQPSRHLKIGAPLGIIGLCLLFLQDIYGVSSNISTWAGIGCALLGSWFFSMGNMVSMRHSKVGMDNLTSNSWSMLYGCLLMFIVNAANGDPLVIDTSERYLGALLYLALIASVLAFPVYLLLVKRIGPSSAAYVLVATPILALAISSYFEHYQWVWTGALGVALILLGNVLVLAPVKTVDRVLAYLNPTNA